MHFIAIVDDPDFRRVAQELVSIGKLILVRMNSISLSILLGAQYGNVALMKFFVELRQSRHILVTWLWLNALE